MLNLILDRLYSKTPDSKQMASVDISSLPYKTENDFRLWLASKFGINFIEQERIARRLAMASYAREEDIKISNADEYINLKDKSSLLGLETVTFELNKQGKQLVGDLPLDIDSDINVGDSLSVLTRSRIKRQLRNVGYDAQNTAQVQLALAELRKNGYLAPKLGQKIDLGIYTDEEKENMDILGEVTKITYIVDLKDDKFKSALAKILASQYTGEKIADLELVEA